MDSTKNSTVKTKIDKIGSQLLSLVFYLLIGWVFAVTCLFVLQRQLQYFPDSLPIGTPDSSVISTMHSVSMLTRDGIVLNSWYSPPKSNEHPVIVFFHGNAGTVRNRINKAKFFSEYGIGVLLVEYRGYGGNPGKPTEGGLYADGRAAFNFLINRKKINASRIVIYGESIGTGIATQMAIEYEEVGLVLEAPFSSVTSLAKRRYPWVPVDVLLWDKYDNYRKVAHIDSPVLVIHGTNDTVVPYVEGEKLYNKAAYPKDLVTIDGGKHSNLYDYTQTGRSIISFLKQNNILMK